MIPWTGSGKINALLLFEIVYARVGKDGSAASTKLGHLQSDYDVILDAVFGFSFDGDDIREPYASLLAEMNASTQVPIVSVDVPSGWRVDGGKARGALRVPEVLVSLTAPKICVEGVAFGKHWLGGRFVPRSLAEELCLDLPRYPTCEQIVQL